MNLIRGIIYICVIAGIIGAWEYYVRDEFMPAIVKISNELTEKKETPKEAPNVTILNDSDEDDNDTEDSNNGDENKKDKVASKELSKTKDVGVSFERGFADIAKEAMQSVVNVATMQLTENAETPQVPNGMFNGSPFDDILKDFFGGQKAPKLKKTNSLGSGFIVKITKEKVYIVTNHHVVDKAKEIKILLADKTELPAKLHAVDQRTDIAVISIDVAAFGENISKIKPVKWEDSDNVEEGNWVVAIGNPFGLGCTVTQGIVSAKGRNIGYGAKSSTNFVEDFIQHSAAINMGNSGGCLLDVKGRVIGINSVIFSNSGGNIGIGFAIPSNVAKTTAEQLIEHKRTYRGWLGAEVQAIDGKRAESVGLAQKTNDISKIFGSFVARVVPGGPADKAGIKKGDIIIEFDGKKISEKNTLQKVVGGTKIEKTVKLKVWRQKKGGGSWGETILNLKVGDFEKAMETGSINAKDVDKIKGDKEEAFDPLGIVVSNVPDSLRDSYPDEIKVIVKKIDETKEMSFYGPLFMPGDGIVSANNKNVTSVAQFMEIMKGIKKDKNMRGKPIPFIVFRNGSTAMLATTIDFPDESGEKKNEYAGPSHEEIEGSTPIEPKEKNKKKKHASNN